MYFMPIVQRVKIQKLVQVLGSVEHVLCLGLVSGVFRDIHGVSWRAGAFWCATSGAKAS